MECHPFEQQDVVFTELNEGNEVSDWSAGNWYIGLHLDKVLEQKLTPEDQDEFSLYQTELANQIEE